jgi:hypothetical protein
MIGIDLPEELKDVKKNLLFKHKIFTGESKPNVIRLLPALNIGKKEADIFLTALKTELEKIKSILSFRFVRHEPGHTAPRPPWFECLTNQFKRKKTHKKGCFRHGAIA